MDKKEEAKREIILLNISGQDQRGVSATITDILARNDAVILDIGQADIHHNLSLGILFMTDSSRSGEIFKQLIFKTNDLKVQINFSIVEEDDYEKWVGMQGKNRYIITILGRRLTALQISKVTRVISDQGLNIDAI